MKKLLLLMTLVFSVSVFATNYTITGGYFGAKTISGFDSLIMTGGGGDNLTGKDNCILNIQNTSSYVPHYGGILDLIVADNSRLNFSGGYVNQLDIGDYATATISGGQINKISAGYYYVDPEHIKIVCQTYNYNATTKLLTGTWRDNSAFNIQLIDVGYGYSSTYSNITVVPEPATLLLLSLGGLLIRRK